MANAPHTLAPESQRLLALAALFQQSFSIDWLLEFSEKKASQVLTILEEAISGGWLVQERPGTFAFTDEEERRRWVSYCPPEERDHLHRRMTEFYLQEAAADETKILAAVPHLLQVSGYGKKFQLLLQAGDIFSKNFQNEKALECYTAVLESLNGETGEKSDLLFIEAAIKYAKVSTARHDTGRIRSIIQEAMLRSRRRYQNASLALLELQLAKNEWLSSRYSSALRHFEQGWSLVKELQDPRLLRSATTFTTFYLYWLGRFREAAEIYEKNISEVEKNPPTGFPRLAAMTMGRCYTHIGQLTQGLGMLDSIRTHCLEKGARYMAAHAVYYIGTALLDIHRIHDAIPYLECALEEAGQENNSWIRMHGNLALATAYSRQGESPRASACLQEYLQRSKEVHTTVRPNPYFMELCWGMEQGRIPRIAGLSLSREVQRTLRDKNVYLKGMAYRYLALLESRQGVPRERILQSLNLSLKWLEESGHQLETAKTLKELAGQIPEDGEKGRELNLRFSNLLSGFNEALLPDDLKSSSQEDPLHQPLDENLLKVILKLAREVVSLRHPRDLVQQIISTVNRITGAERGAIFFLDGGSSCPQLSLKASKNLTPAQIARSEFRSSREMIEEVARTGKGRILGMNSEAESDSASPAAIRSRICVPLILRDKVVGVLYHDNRLLGSAFKDSDLDLLAYFAGQAALAMDNALAYEEIQRLNQKLKEEKQYYEEEHLQTLHFEDLVGESKPLLQVLAQVDQVAATEATVLITGETGVGKELVARAIHRRSPRRDKPFVRVHCNALPETLLPSELFGHEKGAFTGAVNRRIGRFELADGGTIFLDEIGDLPPEVQVRLLRVLQSREFERVGGSSTIRSDFRLVAATNRNLVELVKAGGFRADLFYRLNVIPIHVPPLRERKEDIPLLAHHFLRIYAQKMGKNVGNFSQGEMDKLLGYDWPGNVRELENIMERGLILNTGPAFRVPRLGMENPDPAPSKPQPTLKETERTHILWALQKTGWKVRGPGGTAELLDLHPSTLAFRMKKLDIHRPPGFARKGRRSQRKESVYL